MQEDARIRAEEAERRNARQIQPLHLLLGLLRDEKCAVAKIMLELMKMRAIAFGKAWKGGTDDELEKPLFAIQWVQVPPD